MMKKCNERRRSITKWVGNKTEREKTLSRIANRRAEYRCIVFYLSCISFFEVYWLEAVKDVWKRKGSLFNPIFTAKM